MDYTLISIKTNLLIFLIDYILETAYGCREYALEDVDPRLDEDQTEWVVFWIFHGEKKIIIWHLDY